MTTVIFWAASCVTSQAENRIRSLIWIYAHLNLFNLGLRHALCRNFMPWLHYSRMARTFIFSSWRRVVITTPDTVFMAALYNLHQPDIMRIYAVATLSFKMSCTFIPYTRWESQTEFTLRTPTCCCNSSTLSKNGVCNVSRAWAVQWTSLTMTANLVNFFNPWAWLSAWRRHAFFWCSLSTRGHDDGMVR